ncbi:MAG: hypothetical protein IIV62_02430 [Anaerotignum sp.]|nr:hypothetical protein [Anaerotignum sp.]
MNQRQKKKRGQAKKIDALERGNQYLADLTGRLMEKIGVLERGHLQALKLMEAYMMVLVSSDGGEVGIDKDVLERTMRENYMVCERREDGSVWLTVLEYDGEDDTDGKSD